MPGSFLCGPSHHDEGAGTGGKAWWWCVRGDWCGYFCVLLVWTSTLFVDYCTTKFVLVPHFDVMNTKKMESTAGMAHVLGFQTLIVIIFWCHLTASWADPGLVAKDHTYKDTFRQVLIEAQQREDPAEVRRVKKVYCTKCDTPKPHGSHHCSTCNRCVRHMDHHCPWINNCAAERTLKPFCLFLIYVFMGTTYAMIMMAIRGYRMVMNPAYAAKHRVVSNGSDGPTRFLGMFFVESAVAQLIMCLVAFILALFFCIFVVLMMYDQWEAATTGTPGIDAIQGNFHLPDGQSIPLFVGLKNHIFRDAFSWKWFVPIIPQGRVTPPPPQPPTSPLSLEKKLSANHTSLEKPAQTPPPPPPPSHEDTTPSHHVQVRAGILIDSRASSYRSDDAYTDDDGGGSSIGHHHHQQQPQQLSASKISSPPVNHDSWQQHSEDSDGNGNDTDDDDDDDDEDDGVLLHGENGNEDRKKFL